MALEYYKGADNFSNTDPFPVDPDEQVDYLCRCLHHNKNRIYNQIKFILYGDEHLAMDVMQDTAFSAFKSISRYRGDSTICTWLLKIARNKALSKISRANFSEVKMDMTEIDVPDYAGNQEKAYELKELENLTGIIFDELPEHYRVVAKRRLLDDQSLEEISEELGLQEGTIKSRNNRAKKKLREILAKYGY